VIQKRLEHNGIRRWDKTEKKGKSGVKRKRKEKKKEREKGKKAQRTP